MRVCAYVRACVRACVLVGEGTISSNELQAQVSDLIGKGVISEKELRAVTKEHVTKGKLSYTAFVEANLA